jgi:glutamate transport system permease protein
MSAGVLFDAPGPKTRLRHLVYTIVTVGLLLAFAGFVVARLASRDQFDGDKWEVFVTPVYVEFILEYLVTTLQMAALAIVGAVAIGLVLGIGKLSDHAAIRLPCWALVEFFRAVPVLFLMIFFFTWFGISRGETGSFWSAVLALVLYNGAVLAEVFRAGILAVPHGQAEAAYAIGLRKTQVVWIVLLPQAVKIMIPAIISQCVVTLKDTSLAYAIGAAVLAQVPKTIYLEFQNHVPSFVVIALIYIVLNYLLSLLATWTQKRFVGERKPLTVSMAGSADQRTV